MIMKIGKIISVEYDKFRVRLFHTTRNSTVNIDGTVYYFGNIGSYLKTLNSSGEYGCINSRLGGQRKSSL